MNAKAGGKCSEKQRWEDKTVSAVGYIDQISVNETENDGKFWLRDDNTQAFVEVYVKG